jgi:hypothetical protein
MSTSITIDRRTAGTLGYPSKMPGTSYGISATKCVTGSKLAKIKNSVCHGCYALKGNYLYPDIKKAHRHRLRALKSPKWVAAMTRLLAHMHSPDKHGQPRKGRNGPIVPGWHRWHDSGDIQSVEHLAKICEVAAATPTIKHWLPTRELAFVKDYVGQGRTVPPNLVIRVSATMIDGPATKAWPTTSGVHKDKPAVGHDCPARHNDGKCGECRACWSLDVPHVSYPKH